MTRRVLAFALLLAGSLVLGVLAGSAFFQLFRHTVPPAFLTDFNQAAVHAAFLGYGLLTGILVFLWSLVVIALGRIYRKT